MFNIVSSSEETGGGQGRCGKGVGLASTRLRPYTHGRPQAHSLTLSPNCRLCHEEEWTGFKEDTHYISLIYAPLAG